MSRVDAGSRRSTTETSPPDPERAPGLGPWGYAVAVTIATRVAFFAVAYGASWFLAGTEGGPSQSFLNLWSHWDARLLLLVAENGYTDPASDAHATAFFPLFPLAVAALGAVGVPLVAGGLMVSVASTVVALAYLHKLAEEETGPGAGRRATLYLALFPTAVFLVAPYTEALFLAGAVPAFYYARRRRWHLVGLPAMVAMGARFAGVFLLLGLAGELFRQRRRSRGVVIRAGAAIAAGALPLLFYSAYLAQVKDDAFHFVTDQREGWGRELTNPIAAFTKTWGISQADHYPSDWIFAWRLEVVAALVGVGLVVIAVKAGEWGYAAFMGSMMAVLLSSTWYFSIPRMLLTFFPAALFLARATRNRSELHEIALVLLAPLAALGVVAFTSGAWFF